MVKLEKDKFDLLARNGFSGVISANVDGRSFAEAYGYQDRANLIPNNLDTSFGTASVTKGFTAIAIAKLIEIGDIGIDMNARKFTGDKIENLDPNITISQLLQHTSGIGDYLDEDEIDDWKNFEFSIRPQRLRSPKDYIPLLEEKKQKFAPGTKFSYSNSGYILLALIVELVSERPYQEFVEEQVFKKADMSRSGFFSADKLPANTALGYVDEPPTLGTNIFHLPIRGGGDGGAYTTVDDMLSFWRSFSRGDIVSPALVAKMWEPLQYTGHQGLHYGLGFWVDKKTGVISLIGADVGVSTTTSYRPSDGSFITVISNSTDGGWAMIDHLNSLIRTSQ